jgi:hypothetical protein
MEVSDSPDPVYVAARKVLLDAIEALEQQRDALVVAGAQAVYLQTGDSQLGIAPYTTDGDLAIDPSRLTDEPALEDAMRSAGFQLLEPTDNHPEPGIWVATVNVDGRDLIVPVDLIVPEAIAPPGGRRGARLGVHGNRAARRAVGLEATLVDRQEMTIAALDQHDDRAFDIKVAGVAALLVAKAHKIGDRLNSARPGRAEAKDAADVYRLMQVSRPSVVATTMRALLATEVSAAPTADAIGRLRDLFGGPRSPGIELATDALRLAVPPDQVEVFMVSFTGRLLAELE